MFSSRPSLSRRSAGWPTDSQGQQDEEGAK
jgi:hypothetical protein